MNAATIELPNQRSNIEALKERIREREKEAKDAMINEHLRNQKNQSKEIVENKESDKEFEKKQESLWSKFSSGVEWVWENCIKSPAKWVYEKVKAHPILTIALVIAIAAGVYYYAPITQGVEQMYTAARKWISSVGKDVFIEGGSKNPYKAYKEVPEYMKRAAELKNAS